MIAKTQQYGQAQRNGSPAGSVGGFSGRGGRGDELRDAAAGGPLEPSGEGFAGGFWLTFEGEYDAYSFFEQPGAIKVGVSLLDPGELGLLPVGEVVRVLPQGVAGALEGAGVAG